MDTWIVFTFWLLLIAPLRICMYKHRFLFCLGFFFLVFLFSADEFFYNKSAHHGQKNSNLNLYLKKYNIEKIDPELVTNWKAYSLEYNTNTQLQIIWQTFGNCFVGAFLRL